MERLQGKVSIITGGASGIGAATAKLFSAEGSHVVIADIDVERGVRTADALGRNVTFREADVADESAVQDLVDFTLEQFGRIDCMFNNAGSPGRRDRIEDSEMATVQRELSVLFLSVLVGIKCIAPVMRRQKGGAIISTSSVAALHAGWGSHLYAAAKAAIVQLTRSVATELGEDFVRVNCICPGGIATPLLGKGMGFSPELAEAMSADLESYMQSWQPVPRTGQAADVAHAALFLASDEATFVNGHALTVDGGLTCGRRWSDTKESRNRRIAQFNKRYAPRR